MEQNEKDTVEFSPTEKPSPRSDHRGDGDPPSFPGYQIEGELGRGGIGVVYRGRDLTLNRPVAIKVLSSSEGTLNQRTRILQEARKAAALEDRCIVTVYGVIENDGHSAIVMELIDGHELNNVSAVLEPKQLAKIFSDVARALSAAHEAGILHRDIKPQNIVVTPSHEVRILDFGLSIHVSDNHEEQGFSGTVAYAAPEILQGAQASPSADIYSMGVLIHECLTGRHPFSKLGKPPTISSILAGDPSIPRELKPEIPADLERLCLACLSYRPENRPSAREAYQALLNILIDRPVQLASGRAQDHVVNRIEEHVSTIEKWQQLGLVENRDRDRLRWFYRKVLEGDDMWPTETRKIRPAEIGLYACVWIAIVVAYLCGVYYNKDMGSTWSWLLPLGITTALATAAYLVKGTIQHRIRPLFFSGSILAAIPTMIAILSRFVWVPDEGSSRDLFGFAGIANRTLLLSGLVSLVVSVMRLNLTQFSFYAWLSAGLLAFTHGSVLLLLGFLDWSDGQRALGILSLSISWLVGTGFESMTKPRFARPFHWSSSLAIVCGLTMLGMTPLLKWVGLTSGLRGVDTGWSLAISGLILTGISTFLENSHRLERRRIALFHEWLSPVFLISGLTMAANAAIPRGDSTDTVGYLSLLLLFGSAVFYAILTAKYWRPRYMLACLSGTAILVYTVPKYPVFSTSGFLITCALGSLLVAFWFYWKMIMSNKPTQLQKPEPLPLRED
ncbi:hypothetical protein CBD41_08565 [bacterium TMED181]|nr:hypothetical protein [Planctomycetota bacterium]OUW42749.1 MAG: hypothetical protein CBD41_08565 [bacterium TMED181]